MNKDRFAGKKVLVMGLGRFGGGVDVAKFAAGAGAKVTITDLASAEELSNSIKQLEEFPDIAYHLGSHIRGDFEQADIVIANPAVAPDNEFLNLARRSNKLVTSQINIFLELCPALIIGITGSNGKSTTAALTAHLLRAGVDSRLRGNDRRKVWLSGNIGNEPLLSRIEQIGPDDLVVLELSSFQTEQFGQIQKAPKIALLTNLTPNHLDRYDTFANYCAAKEDIFKYQQLDEDRPAVSLFNGEDELCVEWFERYKTDIGRVCIKFSADDISAEIQAKFPLPGRANLLNLAGAAAIARYLGVDEGAIKSSLPQFKGLPHRLEFVAEINGVRWYNDSKATTPLSTIAALEAFEQPIIIIAGGYDKNLPFDQLGEKIAQNAKAAILMGQTAEKIALSIRNTNISLRAKRSNLNEPDTRYEIRDTKIEIVDSLTNAVKLANNLAHAGDVILFSPACASYDMFENYQQRGKEFAQLVSRIAQK